MQQACSLTRKVHLDKRSTISLCKQARRHMGVLHMPRVSSFLWLTRHCNQTSHAAPIDPRAHTLRARALFLTPADLIFVVPPALHNVVAVTEPQLHAARGDHKTQTDKQMSISSNVSFYHENILATTRNFPVGGVNVVQNYFIQ